LTLSLEPGRLRQSARSSETGKRIADLILQNAENLLSTPLLAIEREEGRDVILPTSRKLIDRVATLAVADGLKGGTTYRRRAIDELLNVCAFADWNPFHFLDTAEMTMGAALGLCWTRSILSRAERDTLANAIVAKGLEPGLDAAAAGADWLHAPNNWNIVCCAGMIAGAAAMEPIDRHFSRTILDRFVPAIRSGLSAFGADGSYTEGPDYWEYAVRYAVMAHAIMKDLGVGPDAPAELLRTWRYARDLTGPSGRVFNFGDATERPRRSPVLGWLAERAGEAQAGVWQHMAPGELHPFDLIWLAPATGPPAVGDVLASYEPAGIAVLRSGSTWLTLKGGRNDVNHAHLDIGTFVLEMAGQRFVSELGRENYALPGYFDPDHRFGYLRTRTEAHSTLLIDGAEQVTSAFATLVGKGSQNGSHFAAYAITDAAHAARWRRGVALQGDHAVFITDEVMREEDQSNSHAVWQLYTEATANLRGSIATLTLNDVTAEAEIVDPPGLAWSLAPASSPAGQSSNAPFSRLFFEAAVPPGQMNITVRISVAGIDRHAAVRPPASIDDWPLGS
jgi:hypothetical protein